MYENSYSAVSIVKVFGLYTTRANSGELKRKGRAFHQHKTSLLTILKHHLFQLNKVIILHLSP